MTRTVCRALFLGVVVVLAAASAQAEAGLFGIFGGRGGCHGDACCPDECCPAECCEEPACCAPTECCEEPACCVPNDCCEDDCAPSGGCRGGKRKGCLSRLFGLFGRNGGHGCLGGSGCCEDSCCPEECCPADCCEEPVCGAPHGCR